MPWFLRIGIGRVSVNASAQRHGTDTRRGSLLHEDTGQEDREHRGDSLLQRVCLFFLVYPELLVILVLVILALVGLAVSG
jgi:hypothetical protein